MGLLRPRRLLPLLRRRREVLSRYRESLIGISTTTSVGKPTRRIMIREFNDTTKILQFCICRVIKSSDCHPPFEADYIIGS